jgi:hypothetical protein
MAFCFCSSKSSYCCWTKVRMEKSVMCSGSSDEMMTATATISFLISTSCLDEYVQANLRISTRWIPPRSPVVMVLPCANERTWLVYRTSRAFLQLTGKSVSTCSLHINQQAARFSLRLRCFGLESSRDHGYRSHEPSDVRLVLTANEPCVFPRSPRKKVLC